jgi:F-type H+-transporting ATPase subunit b
MIDPPSAQALAEGGRQVEEIARTFGVNWPQLLAQMVSFSIVCAALYLLAYGPILRMLEARRQQIKDGLANAERIRGELARIEIQRERVLKKAAAEVRQMIDEARAAAARLAVEERRKAAAAAEDILAGAREAAERDRARMLAEIRHEAGRLVVQTAAAVTGRILTAEDHRRLAEDAAQSLVPST